ncbi:MAG: VanZ family protein [Propionibacteriaceae bacterium]|jgi:glycopeptide antibiotics resistance protein|nr:VanZ family protein [Propionibacteriaceae bacterium]
MLAQAIDSIIVGVALSCLLYVPVVVFQYRRYGRFSASRLIWLCAGLVYLSAIVAYTLFPLPDASADVCIVPSTFILDPTLYFRDMAREFAGHPISELLRSWAMMQMVLNVALFAPLGVIVRQLWGFGVLRATLLGLGVSLFIETTQFTGNWFLAPCQYRVADINDLLTNTLGALLGAVFALLLPRLAADPAELEAHRLEARPVTRGRRWIGQLLDLLIAAVFTMVVAVLLALAVTILRHDGHQSDAELQRVNEITGYLSLGIAIGGILLLALTGSGASLGQRIVYLKPVPLGGARWRLVLRAGCVQGLGLGLLLFPGGTGNWSFALIGLAIISVVFTPRGLSCLISGCVMADARGDMTPPE